MPLKIAILASGSGTNAERIISLCRKGRLDAEPVLLISNRPGAKALERAKDLNTPVCAMDHEQFPDRISFDAAMLARLQEAGCELVVLAGYMRLLTGMFLKAFPGRVINIHPALLPSFPGLNGARDAVEYGVKISGASVHFVEEEMDRGPLIIQGAVPVRGGESTAELKNRIHAVEYKIYPQAIQWIARNRLRIEGRHIFLQDADLPKLPQPPDCLIWPPLEDAF